MIHSFVHSFFRSIVYSFTHDSGIFEYNAHWKLIRPLFFRRNNICKFSYMKKCILNHLLPSFLYFPATSILVECNNCVDSGIDLFPEADERMNLKNSIRMETIISRNEFTRIDGLVDRIWERTIAFSSKF